MLDKEASQSVHMQLSELKSFEETESKVATNITIGSFYCTSTNSISVATVCLSSSTKEKLEYFGLHLLNANLTLLTDKFYTEV